jgi:uncharacterized protein (DUF2237 family)
MDAATRVKRTWVRTPCVCAARWKEAHDVGLAPPVDLEATQEAALGIVSLEDLISCAVAHEA